MAAVIAAVLAIVIAVAGFAVLGGDDGTADAAAADAVVSDFWGALDAGDGEQACGRMTSDFQQDFFARIPAAEGATSCEEAVAAYARVVEECEIDTRRAIVPVGSPDRIAPARGDEGFPRVEGLLSSAGETLPHPHVVYDLVESDGELKIYAEDTTAPGFQFDPQPTPDTRKFPGEEAFVEDTDDESILRDERFFPTREC